MDLRASVLALVVGGSPAPGINSVISAVTLEAINQGLSVLGFYQGFELLANGRSNVTSFKAGDVSRITDKGGSILKTSDKQLENEKEVEACLRVMKSRRVRYLVTIGGTKTAVSASLLAAMASKKNINMSCVHVPKTVYNDLPLPLDALTFGFDTARQVGVNLIRTFQTDARTLNRWYVLVVLGKRSGMLCMNIGKAACATVTMIPEDFGERMVAFDEICDVIEATVHKRVANGKQYGLALVSEGLVNLLPKEDILRLGANVEEAYSTFAVMISAELNRRLGRKEYVMARTVGSEFRGAAPSAADILLARDLGFCATRFLLDEGHGCMITLQGGRVLAIPFEKLLDQETGLTKTRKVDPDKIAYQVAQSYMFKLRKSDLADGPKLRKMASMANMTTEEFIRRFAYVAQEDD